MNSLISGIWKKDLAEKKSQARGGEKSKRRPTIAFLVNAAGEKAIEQLVVWRIKKPRCFKNIMSLSRPHGIYYYSNPKVWMITEILTSILGKINRQMEVAKRKLYFLWITHRTILKVQASNIPTSKSCFCQKTRLPDSNR